MNACESILLDPRRRKPLDPFRMSIFRAERADIKAIRFERRRDRRIVDFRIVRKRNERRPAIEPDLRQRLVGPLGKQSRIGKTLTRRESRARIDNRDRIAKHPRHRREDLADMHRTCNYH